MLLCPSLRCGWTLVAKFWLHIHFVLDVCKFWGALTNITTTATSKYMLVALISIVIIAPSSL